MSVSNYNTDPDLNTTISGINIAEGCPPSGINNAIRQMMADVKSLDGTLVHTSGNEAVAGNKTFSGKVQVSNNIYNPADDSATILFGGTDNTSARLRVNGKDASSNPNRFSLYAGSSVALTGDPDGVIQWNGKNVERVHASSFASLAGYIRYSNGLQIVWGQESSLSAAASVTFTVPFAHTPCIVGSANKSASVYVTVPSTTGCTINCSAYNSTAVRWVAIGDWA